LYLPATRPYYVEIMSTYLLLRNNQESGPFTIEEIKAMSLKTYDLLWIVGKSAAWRYPGEINEFKAFAPPLPEQESASLYAQSSKSELKSQRIYLSKSVYVNLPAEKKRIAVMKDPASEYTVPVDSTREESSYHFSELDINQPTRAVRNTGKLLWVSTIVLLFGAGLLTGFFIADRGKYFTTDANHPQIPTIGRPGVPGDQMENESVLTSVKQRGSFGTSMANGDSVKQTALPGNRLTGNLAKKKLKNAETKKDSLQTPAAGAVSTNNRDSSLKQSLPAQSDALYQKVRAHPENYVSVLTGRYTTGLFGGISSVPITVTNNSPVKLDLVVVNISYVQNNQKVFKTENISFNDLEPGETVTEKSPKSPRGVKISTHIQIIDCRQLDLNYSN
jgi:hypothetical protein